MAQTNRFLKATPRAAAIAAVVVALAAVGLVVWTGPFRHPVVAQDGVRPSGPLISRGYTDAPAGTAVIAGDPALGGAVILELRIKEGQQVKRGQIVAVLSNYPVADVEVRSAEAELAKARQQREAMVSGFRTAEIAMQEIIVKSEAETNKLKALEMQRTSMPPDQKQLELNIAQQNLEREQVKLRLQKETLAADLAQKETDIHMMEAKLDTARVDREQSLVRSPLDGMVSQLFSRQGERVSGKGIAKVVDLGRMRVFADVDEMHLARLTQGARVEVTFRGNKTIYTGRIARAPLAIARTKRSEADLGEVNAPHMVEIEIELDNTSAMPQLLGNESRVTFL
ncbi:MAG: HlyD family efflux transporter periplasmic adaptor subunit [Rhodospirillales bacterium]|nr:HlyD family efflux transporter periplasmic adaptor subunit [Rhodospirillales bacterium]